MDSAAPLPLRGTKYTTRIPFGDTVLTLTASARTSLTGSLGVILPWAAGSVGLLLTIAAALLTERLVRRRTTAERRSTEVGRLYEEQRSVAETLQHALLPQLFIVEQLSDEWGVSRSPGGPRRSVWFRIALAEAKSQGMRS